MVEVPEEGNFAEGGDGDAFLPALCADLLQSDDLAVLVVDGLVDDSVGSFPQFVQFFES